MYCSIDTILNTSVVSLVPIILSGRGIPIYVKQLCHKLMFCMYVYHAIIARGVEST